MIHLENDRFTLIGALQRYKLAWRKLLTEHGLEVISQTSVATTVSWKVGDKARLFADLEEIAPHTEQVHIGTVNDRFIASAVLKKPMEDSLWIVKILERRPRSVDPLGLDSVDFITKDPAAVFAACKQAGLTVVRERNPMHEWISVRFGANDEFEAKFTDHLVLDIAEREIRHANDAILARL